MLLEFSVRNFGPIREESTLSALAMPGSNESVSRLDGDVPVLPVIGIYGANASGKTSFIDAMTFLGRLVTDSGSTKVGEPLPDMGFRFSKDIVPTVFRVVFSYNDRYEFGVSILNGVVIEEYLRYDDGDFIYNRKGNGIELLKILESDRRMMEELCSVTDGNNLYLSRCMQFRIRCTMDAGIWFQECITVPRELGPDSYNTLLYISSMKDRMVDIMSNADLGISDIRIENVRNGLGVTLDGYMMDPPRLVHRIVSSDAPEDCSLELGMESRGTRHFMATMSSVLDALDNGWLLIVDEIDRSLHPLLVDYIIRLFTDPESNDKGAQLLFTSHDTLIPERNSMNMDQIWFASRNPFEGRTVLYPASNYDIEDISRFSNDYLEGRMGATPIVRWWRH